VPRVGACLWLVAYALVFWIGGVVDYYWPDLLQRWFYDRLGG